MNRVGKGMVDTVVRLSDDDGVVSELLPVMLSLEKVSCTVT